MKLRVDPLTGMPSIVEEPKYVSITRGGGQLAGSIPFITNGSNGVTSIRWQSTPSGNLFNMTLDDTGAVVTTAIRTGSPIGLLLALTYP